MSGEVSCQGAASILPASCRGTAALVPEPVGGRGTSASRWDGGIASETTVTISGSQPAPVDEAGAASAAAEEFGGQSLG